MRAEDASVEVERGTLDKSGGQNLYYQDSEPQLACCGMDNRDFVVVAIDCFRCQFKNWNWTKATLRPSGNVIDAEIVIRLGEPLDTGSDRLGLDG